MKKLQEYCSSTIWSSVEKDGMHVQGSRKQIKTYNKQMLLQK